MFLRFGLTSQGKPSQLMGEACYEGRTNITSERPVKKFGPQDLIERRLSAVRWMIRWTENSNQSNPREFISNFGAHILQMVPGFIRGAPKINMVTSSQRTYPELNAKKRRFSLDESRSTCQHQPW